VESPKIYEITDSYKLYIGNALEEWRCRTFFTKEPETIEWIDKLFENGDVFYDVGANVGVYSLYAAIKYPDMLVYSFEPCLMNFLRLNDNIHLNKLTNVVPLYIALSDVNSIEKFFVKDDRIGSSGNQISENVNEKGVYFEPLEEFYVPVYSLDAFIEQFSLPNCNHIKIDVDGVEGKIIDGMRRTLQHPSLKSVLVEINHDANDFNDIVNLIQGSGLTADNPFNSLPNHSRYRRKGTPSESAENVVFVRWKG